MLGGGLDEQPPDASGGDGSQRLASAGIGIQQGSLYSKAWLARYDRLFRMVRALPLE